MIYSKDTDYSALTKTFTGFETFPKSVPKKSNLTKKRLKNRRKGKKGKMSSRKAIVPKIDALVSKIVIERYKKCVVCGSTKQLGCGHIFARSHYSTRFDITIDGNCHAQCWKCNYRHKFDPIPYYSWYQNLFGMKGFIALYNRWKTIKQYKTKDLEKLLKKYERTL